MICAVNQGTEYEITIGFFHKAASRVAVPLAIRTESADSRIKLEFSVINSILISGDFINASFFMLI